MPVDRSLLIEFLQLYPFQPATAWWRAIEVAHLLRHPLPAGLGLDVGCGDGLLTRLIAAHAVPAERTWIGLDADPAEAALAIATKFYKDVLITPADRIDQPSQHFDFALSNSVLEHIPEIDPVLHEVARVLKPGARFLLTVPSAHFHECLRGPSPLRRTLLRQDRSQYWNQIDQRVAHRHYWTEEHWQQSLRAAGFGDVQFSSYFSAPEVQRWETISNLTAGVLYELLGHRTPIEIQRSLGLRRSAAMPQWLGSLLAPVLSLRARPDTGHPRGGLMVVARRDA